MSGGYFEYRQYTLTDLSSYLSKYIERIQSKTPDECGYVLEFTDETIKKFKECMFTLNLAADMFERVDWLASGDDSEETFHERWSQIEGLKKVPIVNHNSLRFFGSGILSDDYKFADIRRDPIVLWTRGTGK